MSAVVQKVLGGQSGAEKRLMLKALAGISTQEACSYPAPSGKLPIPQGKDIPQAKFKGTEIRK